MRKLVLFSGAMAILIASGFGFYNRLQARAELAPPAPPKVERVGKLAALGERIRGFVEIEERAVPVAAFSRLTLTGSGNVKVRIGATPGVVVKADKRIIHTAEVRQNGDEVILDDQGIPSFIPFLAIEYEVTVPSLSHLTINGSGNITLLDTLEADAITLQINGSGNITGDLRVQNGAVRSSGSGNLLLSGTVEALSAELNGSGDIEADALNGQNAVIKLGGSGDVDVGSFTALDVAILGSGNVEYSGAPQLQVKKTGSGDVVSD